MENTDRLINNTPADIDTSTTYVNNQPKETEGISDNKELLT